MNVANKQSSKSKREDIGNVEIDRLEREILELNDERRAARMQAYRRLLASSADELVYFMRS